MPSRALADWPTLALLALAYALWGLAITVVSSLALAAGIALAAIAITLHASLTHEAVHGHPTDDDRVNHALVWPVLGLLVPYGRFRDTHLAHHRDARLTDPYDDPETNYLDPAVWVRLPGWRKALLRANNTLLGRIVLGPILGQIAFMAEDARAIRTGDRAVRAAWLAHIPPVAAVLALVWAAPMPLWAYAVAVYAGSGLLRIRTFLEHRAHAHPAGRTVVIEDRGPLALLYLNNNFHLVHHMHPSVPWFRLPALYDADAERYLRRNQGYRYRSYGQVFARHFLRAKDPVPHPLWPAADSHVEAFRPGPTPAVAPAATPAGIPAALVHVAAPDSAHP